MENLHTLTELLPFKIALIGVLGIGAQWLAWRLQRPAIVLMAIAGLIFGPFMTWLFTLDFACSTVLLMRSSSTPKKISGPCTDP